MHNLQEKLYEQLSSHTATQTERGLLKDELKVAADYMTNNRQGLAIFPYDDIHYLQELIEILTANGVTVDQFEVIHASQGVHGYSLFHGDHVGILYHY